MRLHLQPHLFAAERSRELLFHVIPSDARRNACLQEHSDEAAHEPQRGEVPTWEKCLLAGAFRRSGAEPQRGEVPTWEECLLAGAFRRSGARAPKGRSWGVSHSSVIPSEQGVSLRRGIPGQGTGCNKRGDPSRARARVFRRALLPFGMTQGRGVLPQDDAGGGAFSHGMTQGAGCSPTG